MKQLFLKIGGMVLAVGSAIVLLFVLQTDKRTTTIKELAEESSDQIEDGVHVRTGLIAKEGYQLVINNCTSCHSAKLVIQNRMTTEQWNATIRWMQATQNLWELGDNQTVIVDYLVDNYPVTNTGRRANLTAVEWYELE